ncbi:MAG: penicillin-binding protein 1A [Rickettsiaceae bacterium]|nr:penicillin-binding protein 1A [Rickettsiaceae bacterium]MDP4832424.1 penicillin-binding protein 1A [Rickettsiaceae bacterium]MDP5020153.1 penicillin-binding protein 1A [Rickettsiaceae bacterium]
MLLRFIIFCTKMVLFFGTIGIAIAAYVIYHYSKDLPDYSQLKRYYPPSITRMYSADAKLIEEYAREHRIFVSISAVPRSLVEAFVAAEDKNFYSHEGIDIMSIIRAAINNVSRIINNRRVEGGSTITQQVVKNFLLTSERSLDRKIKEAILSYMVTQAFTKEETLELYLNQIYLGKGAYGVASAALNYFNKSVEELTLNESAVLASLPKAPSKYNPARDYERAFERKNYVIGRMYDDGYITEAEARAAIVEPIKLATFDKVQTLDADYYAEKVREEVIGMFGEEYFYTAGLTIITCVDSKMQEAAANALRFGIKKFDMLRGYRGPLKNISIINWNDELRRMDRPEGLRHYQLSIVLEVHDNEAKIGLRDGNITKLFLKDMKWTTTNLKSIHKLLKVGDVIVVEKVAGHYVLQQIPEVNGGIMVVEHKTGRVLAAEGGYDFGISKFDRTTQAKRQPGSLIKPFVYLSALEAGARPTDIFEDAPIEIVQGPGLPLWKPKNYEENFLGPVTMRMGLEKSRNTITVRVGQFAGWQKVADTIKRFGINDNPKVVPSMVLGALETTLAKMTIAYSIIANNGRQVEPHYIELIKDRKGNVIYKRDYTECPECKSYMLDNEGKILPPEITISPSRAITDEASSYQITSLMMGGIQRGTGRGAKNVDQIIAGKTGTTNKAKDAWFMGFTPKIVVGTYVGHDTPKSMGKRVSGASIALPIFVHFMQNGYKDEPSVDFIVPDTITLAMVDYATGKPSTEKDAILEAFKINNFNPALNAVPKEVVSEKPEYDPFANIQKQDTSQELY